MTLMQVSRLACQEAARTLIPVRVPSATPCGRPLLSNSEAIFYFARASRYRSAKSLMRHGQPLLARSEVVPVQFSCSNSLSAGPCRRNIEQSKEETVIRNIGLLIADGSIGVTAAQPAMADNMVDLPGDLVLITTPSGKTVCDVKWELVGCGVSFDVPTPVPEDSYGSTANGAVVYRDGEFRWVSADYGGGRTFMPVSYGVTYRAAGWTFTTTDDGTTFTNDATGHGMFVSTKGVKNF
jgi:hypothetical protein